MPVTRKIWLAATAVLMTLLCSCACPGQSIEAQSATPLGNKDDGKVETAIGDLAADSLREALKTDIALVAASELKPKDPPFAVGKVLASDITDLISFPNDPLAILQMDGKTIRQVLERAVSIYPQPNLGFFQVSGLKFSFDPSKPAGARVASVTVGSSPISDGRVYTVAVTNSMANGALGYWKVWAKDNIRTRLPDATLAKAIGDYLKSHPRLDYGTLGRITLVK